MTRPDVALHHALPDDPSPSSLLTVVLHGTERNAADYRDAWRAFARDHDRIVVCPEFDRAAWPGAKSYVLGNMTGKPESEWVFSQVTAVAAATAERFGLTDRRFDLWGHSAGAQVVHRYTLFQPDAPLRVAIAANAGWYTRPGRERWPYGTRDVDPELVRRWRGAPLVLMRGELDVERDPTLRVTSRADAQGPNRFVRAAAMLAAGRTAGQAADHACRWELRDVPGVGHDFTGMAAAAQRFLVGRENPFTDGSRLAQKPTPIW